MRTRVLALILAASAPALAADRGFDRLNAAVEKHLGVRRTHIPLMGLANFFVKVARPEGARGLKLAVFENVHLRPEDGAALDGIMAEAAAGLHPMVKTRSSRGERTYIYTGGADESTMLIATFDRDEATVIEIRVDAKALARALSDPANAGHVFTAGPSEE